MADKKPEAFVPNIAEVSWNEYPSHFGGSLPKPLVDLVFLVVATSVSADPV